jgi:hypothetical protein
MDLLFKLIWKFVELQHFPRFIIAPSRAINIFALSLKGRHIFMSERERKNFEGKRIKSNL